MTKGIWYWGKTGVGKSHKVYADTSYNVSTHYDYPYDNGWWDGYRQQKYVIFNDFRDELKFNELLRIVDKWPFSVKRRCREPMPFLSEIVMITSSCPPEEIYRNSLSENDKLDQFHRRFNVIELT